MFWGRLYITNFGLLYFWSEKIEVFVDPTLALPPLFKFFCNFKINIFLGFTPILLYPWLRALLPQNVEWVEIPTDETKFKISATFINFLFTGPG